MKNSIIATAGICIFIMWILVVIVDLNTGTESWNGIYLALFIFTVMWIGAVDDITK